MGWLSYEPSGLFSLEARAESPRMLPGETGIRMSARRASFDGEAVTLELLIRYSFPAPFLQQFQRVLEAMTLVLEDAAEARIAVAPLLDPHKRYPRLSGPNLLAHPPPPSSEAGFEGGWVNVPLRIPLAKPNWAGPSLFATAFVQDQVSNTVAVELPEATVTTYLGGSALTLPTEAEAPHPLGEDTPDDGLDDTASSSSPKVPPARESRLTLVPRASGPFRPDGPMLLDGTLSLEPRELALGGAEAWLRSVFVVATQRETQHSGLGHWLGDRVVFPDAGQTRSVGGAERITFALPVDLVKVLGPLPPATYYIQLSARQHRSPVLEVSCE